MYTGKTKRLSLETIKSDEEGRYIFANLKLATEKLFVVQVNVHVPTDCRLQTPFLQKLTYVLVRASQGF